MKAKTSAQLRKIADKELQIANKRLNKACEACGGANQVGHHWIEKSRSSFLRYDLRNIIPLCNSCHSKIHNIFGNSIVGGLNIAETIINKRGREWKELMDKLQPTYVKTDTFFYQSNIDRLKKLSTFDEK